MKLLSQEKAQLLFSKGFIFDYPEHLINAQPLTKKGVTRIPGGPILSKTNSSFFIRSQEETRAITLQDLLTWMNNRFSYQIKQTNDLEWQCFLLLDKEQATIKTTSLADTLYEAVLTALDHKNLTNFDPLPTFKLLD